jgi:hypothetical protein
MHVDKKYGGVELKLHALLNSVDGGNCSTSALNRWKESTLFIASSLSTPEQTFVGLVILSPY